MFPRTARGWRPSAQSAIYLSWWPPTVVWCWCLTCWCAQSLPGLRTKSLLLSFNWLSCCESGRLMWKQSGTCWKCRSWRWLRSSAAVRRSYICHGPLPANSRRVLSHWGCLSCHCRGLPLALAWVAQTQASLGPADPRVCPDKAPPCNTGTSQWRSDNFQACAWC